MNLELYVVRNQEGHYFRAKGFGGYGKTWVDDIQKAKVYPKLAQARSRVTWFYNNYPEYGIPNIIKLTVSEAEVMDESERVLKAKKAKEVKEQRADMRRAKKQSQRS